MMTAQRMMLSVVSAPVLLLVVLYISGSAAVKCYSCDPCPRDFANMTKDGMSTCEGNYCELSLVGDVFKRSCQQDRNSKLDSGFDHVCMIEETGTKCLCEYADFCTKNCPWNCEDRGQGVGGAPKTTSGHVMGSLVALIVLYIAQ